MKGQSITLQPYAEQAFFQRAWSSGHGNKKGLELLLIKYDFLRLQRLLSLHVLKKATQRIIIVEDLAPRRLKKETTERVRLWNEDTVG